MFLFLVSLDDGGYVMKETFNHWNGFVEFVLWDFLRFKEHDAIKGLSDQLEKISFLSILIQSKNTGQIILRHVFYIIEVVLNQFRWDFWLVDHFGRYEVVKHSFKQSSIVLICNSTTINDLSYKVIDGFKWNLVKRCDKIIYYSKTCGEVAFIEIVQNVPSKWAEFTPLENYCMEET